MKNLRLSLQCAAACAAFVSVAAHALDAREVDVVKAPTEDKYFYGSMAGAEQASPVSPEEKIVFSKNRVVFPAAAPVSGKDAKNSKTGKTSKAASKASLVPCPTEYQVLEEGTGNAMYQVLDSSTHALVEGARGYPFQYRVIKIAKSACHPVAQVWQMKVRLDNPRLVETKIYMDAYGPKELFRETVLTRIE